MLHTKRLGAALASSLSAVAGTMLLAAPNALAKTRYQVQYCPQGHTFHPNGGCYGYHGHPLNSVEVYGPRYPACQRVLTSQGELISWSYYCAVAGVHDLRSISASVVHSGDYPNAWNCNRCFSNVSGTGEQAVDAWEYNYTASFTGRPFTYGSAT